jgi:hypothetical protein
VHCSCTCRELFEAVFLSFPSLWALKNHCSLEEFQTDKVLCISEAPQQMFGYRAIVCKCGDHGTWKNFCCLLDLCSWLSEHFLLSQYQCLDVQLFIIKVPWELFPWSLHVSRIEFVSSQVDISSHFLRFNLRL